MFGRKARQITRLEQKLDVCTEVTARAVNELRHADAQLASIGQDYENLQVSLRVLYGENTKLLSEVTPLQQRLYDALEEREQLLAENADLVRLLDEIASEDE